MRYRFTKMHGLGNDFVVVRESTQQPPTPAQIKRLGDRRRGIGFDQLLWLEAPRRSGDDVHYRVFNQDGTEAEQCGNGARCITRLLATPGKDEFRLGHAGGTARARIEADGNVSVEMAVPEFAPARVPFRADQQQLRYRIDAGDTEVEAGVVSMGNPHAVLQVADVDHAPVSSVGAALEANAAFPNRANIGFMQVVSPDRIRLRVFERGVGETQACGTGACAAVVVGRTWQLLNPRVTVELPGGQLTVRWAGPGESAWMTGEAVTVFEGTFEA